MMSLRARVKNPLPRLLPDQEPGFKQGNVLITAAAADTAIA